MPGVFILLVLRGLGFGTESPLKGIYTIILGATPARIVKPGIPNTFKIDWYILDTETQVSQLKTGINLWYGKWKVKRVRRTSHRIQRIEEPTRTAFL